jgi:hypothetical protein
VGDHSIKLGFRRKPMGPSREMGRAARCNAPATPRRSSTRAPSSSTPRAGSTSSILTTTR